MSHDLSFIPVSKPYIPSESISLLNQVVSSNQFSYGPISKQFEKELSDYFNCEYVLLTSSGTTALHLALRSLGVESDSNVIVPDVTFVATANAAKYCNSNVILSDIDLSNWCIDQTYVNGLTSKHSIDAIILVDLYGVVCPDIKSESLLISDSCESFKLHPGIVSIFSFYGNKIISCGEGGAIATNDYTLYSRAYHLRGQAMTNERYFHDDIGYNYRITEMQSALGLGQLRVIDKILDNRREIVNRYHDRLENYITSDPCSNSTSSPWLYTFQLTEGFNRSDRDGLIDYLASLGIETRPCFVPLHRQPMYRNNNGNNLLDKDFPVSCLIADRALSLPTWTGLSLSLVDKISESVVSWVNGR